jgi:hypothetical protein
VRNFSICDKTEFKDPTLVFLRTILVKVEKFAVVAELPLYNINIPKIIIRNRVGVKTYLQKRTFEKRFPVVSAILSNGSIEMRKTRRNKKQKKIPTPGPSQCHPRVGSKRPAHGCLPVNVLERAATQLGIPKTSPISLRKALEANLKIPPGQELSFVRALPFSDSEKDTLIKSYLRTPQPDKWKEDPDMWLDSVNIENVMRQYEEAFPAFEFMGPFPIDFAAPDPYNTSGGDKKCLMKEICNLRVEQALQQGTKSIGIIYNLDPHFKDGSHWVANFVDIPNHKCYYFDSYGYEPPKQIAIFMKWLTTQDPKMKLMYNARRFQMQGSECGMYSLYFIIRMLAGDEFRPFCRKQPRDSVMLDLRDWLFST